MRRPVLLTIACDVAAVTVAGTVASFGWPLVAPPPRSALVLFGVSALLLCGGFRLYTSHTVLQPERTVAVIVAATALASLVFVLPVPGPDVLTVPQTADAWLLFAGALVLGRLGMARFVSAHLAAGQPTLIVGAGRVGRIVEQRLHSEPELGLNPVGFLDDDPLYAEGSGTGATVLGGVRELEKVVCERRIRHVLIAFSKASDDELVKLVRECERLGVSVAVVPRLFELTARTRGIRYLGGISLVRIRRSAPTRLRVRTKDLIDRVVSAVLIVLFAPLLAVTSAAVFVSLGRPIFFRQRRVGKDGQTFEILKLRTMRDDPVTGDGSEESYRCSRVGAFLRRTSLDEVPQLLNILRGEMSFIGPRPERPELVADFRRRIYRYDERHRVKGGISGWAQVYGIGRGEDRFANSVLSDRAEWDNFYIEHWSPMLELRILLRSLPAMWRFSQGSSAAAVAEASEPAAEVRLGADIAGDQSTPTPTPTPAELLLGSIAAGEVTPAPGQVVVSAGAGVVDGSGQP